MVGGGAERSAGPSRRSPASVHLFTRGVHAGSFQCLPPALPGSHSPNPCHLQVGKSSGAALKAERLEGDGPSMRSAGPEAATAPGHSHHAGVSNQASKPYFLTLFSNV